MSAKEKNWASSPCGQTTLDSRVLRRHSTHLPLARLTSKRGITTTTAEGAPTTTKAVALQQPESKKQQAAAARGSSKNQAGKTAVGHKADALESIMAEQSATAHRQIQRFRFRREQATRVAINPALVPGHDVEVLSKRVLTDADLSEAVEKPDDELLDSGSFEAHQAGEAGDCLADSLPGRLGQLLASGVGTLAAPSIGLGFPVSTIDGDQDSSHGRLFACQCDRFTLLGVVNGHGQPCTARQLEELVAQEMPRAVFRSPSLVRCSDPPAALRAAFNSVHHIAVGTLDVRLAGAACTVCLWDSDTIWVAHVGDCRAVLGVPDSQQNALSCHFAAVPLTKDHIIASAPEYDRVVAAGAELRNMEGDKGYRLFLPKGDLPGLGITRAIGDRIGHMVGVSHAPSIGFVSREGLAEGCFLLLGSGGLWATMSERHVVNWIGSNFDSADAAAVSLAEESLRRWEQPGWCKHLPAALQDCFACAVAFFGERSPKEPAQRPSSTKSAEGRQLALPAVLATPRTFLVGPNAASVKKPWKEVKSKDRTDAMRRLQAHRQHRLQEPTACPELAATV